MKAYTVFKTLKLDIDFQDLSSEVISDFFYYVLNEADIRIDENEFGKLEKWLEERK